MTDDVTSNDHGRSWLFGAGFCVFFAAVVGACSLASDGAGNSVASTDTEAPTPETAAPVETTGQSTTATTTVVESTVPAPATSAETEGEVAVEPRGISFASDIKPIITETCASCHTGNGPGTQHVRFDTANDVARTSFAVAIVAETRFMPPWPASDESVAFQHDWSLSDDEIAAIVEWDDAGGLLDVPTDDPMIAVNGVVGISEPDIVALANGSYDGEFGQDDEYRCFVYDPEVTETTYASQLEFRPEQTQVVHHAVGFRVGAQDRAEIDEIDGADGQGGWTCFGFSPGRSADLVFTWAPGTDATAYPDGSGLEVGPGDFFVLQTHYHFDVEAEADQSSFAIEWAEGDDIEPVDLFTYLAPAEIPCSSDEIGPLCDRSAARERAVAAYGQEGVLADALVGACGASLADFAEMTDGIASSRCDWPVVNPGEIVSVFGHEHEIGKSFRMTLNPGTPDEVILLDIPDWDFDWQLIYEPVESIVIERSDTIRIECTWDRSRRDPALEPAYVLWADGTDDEMCFSSVVTR